VHQKNQHLRTLADVRLLGQVACFPQVCVCTCAKHTWEREKMLQRAVAPEPAEIQAPAPLPADELRRRDSELWRGFKTER
jgi:hypothetical protein